VPISLGDVTPRGNLCIETGAFSMQLEAALLNGNSRAAMSTTARLRKAAGWADVLAVA
jgi:hypothetical protein